MKRNILALTLALSLFLSSCGGGTSAATIHLRKTEGTVGVSDGEGKGVEPRENLGLYSGYGVGTQVESYAWIDLDSVKLTKLDEDSEIVITKDGKNLEIDVVAGNLFFNVTEPLADDETMNIRTSTMVVGIRGTCGWVTQDAAALLEGTVEVTAGEESVTITAGEMAALTADGALEVMELPDIPAFVLTELEDSGEPAEAVPGGTPAGTGFVPWAEAGLTDHVMDWRDDALAAKMAEVTGIAGRDILLSDVWELSSLQLDGAGISDISALGELTNLLSLLLSDNNISDISALSSLTNLRSLGLDNTNISDISVLSGMTGLKDLALNRCGISDLSALSSLTGLQTLHLDYNNISGISALSGMTSLQTLGLGHNNISDISALSGMTDLEYLLLAGNNISDLSALSGLTNLQTLYLGSNSISDVSALGGLTSLQSLGLASNNISDVSALSGLTGLESLDLTDNNITGYAPVEFVPNLFK